jgi:hypothetical protein
MASGSYFMHPSRNIHGSAVLFLYCHAPVGLRLSLFLLSCGFQVKAVLGISSYVMPRIVVEIHLHFREKPLPLSSTLKMKPADFAEALVNF